MRTGKGLSIQPGLGGRFVPVPKVARVGLDGLEGLVAENVPMSQRRITISCKGVDELCCNWKFVELPFSSRIVMDKRHAQLRRLRHYVPTEYQYSNYLRRLIATQSGIGTFQLLHCDSALS
jgi:hypothetical protein